jgi:hypothetical protein
MARVRSSALLREIAMSPCASGRFRQQARFRRAAIDLVESESLLKAAYCFRIVALDEPPSHVLRAGGETLDAARLVPQSGQLTAVAVAVFTLGLALERRGSALFAERRMSLALALDKLGNELLFALSRRVEDWIITAARKARLTVAGELRAGDPGLPLEAQAAMQRLAGADQIGVSVTPGQVLHPLKSMSLMLGVGINLPPARWSRCDDCPSAPKCTMSGRIAAPAML